MCDVNVEYLNQLSAGHDFFNFISATCQWQQSVNIITITGLTHYSHQAFSYNDWQ